MTEQAQTLSGDTTLALPEFDAPPKDPGPLLARWIDDAAARAVREPCAAVLATADAAGRPSSRVLLVKDVDERGLLFTGSRESRKGRDLAASPWASLTFYWRETLQQLTVEGPVETLDAKDSDALFESRPLSAQIASTVSRQGRPLADETALKANAAALRETASSLPRPPEWTGYRLVPHTIEFWYGSPDRLHRRLRYHRTDAGSAGGTWSSQRLQP